MPKATNTGGGDFPVCPEGLFNAVCVDVVDLGLEKEVWEGKTKEQRKVRFVFQVDARDDDDNPVRDEGGERDGRMFEVWSKFTLSLGDRAKLLPFVQAWTGKTIPKEVREEGFEMDNLIGRYAQVTIVHNKSEAKNRTYANINGIMPLARGAKKFEPDEYVRVRDRQGYEPPYGSDDWEEQQERKQRDANRQGQGRGRDETPPEDEDDDDLPF